MKLAQATLTAEQDIWDFLQTKPQFTRAEIATTCAATRYVRDQYLDRLLGNGLVTACGKAGNTLMFTVTKQDDVEQDELLKQFIATTDRFTREQMMALENVSRIAAKRFFARLKETGHLHMVAKIGSVPLYSTRDPGEIRDQAKDKRLSPQGRIWTAMRIARNFTPQDLQAGLGQSDDPVSLKQVQRFCSLLTEAGYLRATQKARNGKHPAKYQLVRNTGPLPPTSKKLPVIVDENEERVVFVKGENLQ